MDSILLSFSAIPAITVILYICAEILKVTLFKTDSSRNYLPLVCAVAGAVVCGAMYFIAPTLLGVTDVLSAIGGGIVSGLTATGANQLYNKLVTSTSSTDSDTTEELEFATLEELDFDDYFDDIKQSVTAITDQIPTLISTAVTTAVTQAMSGVSVSDAIEAAKDELVDTVTPLVQTVIDEVKEGPDVITTSEEVVEETPAVEEAAPVEESVAEETPVVEEASTEETPAEETV